MFSIENHYNIYHEPVQFTQECGHIKDLCFMRIRSLCNLNYCPDCNKPFTEFEKLFLDYSPEPTLLVLKFRELECTHQESNFTIPIQIIKPVATQFIPQKVENFRCCGINRRGEKCKFPALKNNLTFCRYHLPKKIKC